MAKMDVYLRFMIEQGASDFHLCSTVVPMFRVDGNMVPLNTDALSHEQCKDLIEEILPEKNAEEFWRIHDTDFAYAIEGLARFRFNVFMDTNGIGAVVRQIPADILSADVLGLPKAVRDLCQLTKGLVVVTGPTGSGKSTTLAAMIDLMNETCSDHIITIEDPVEFVHKNKRCLINHREVGKHTSSFKRALKAALREDPDILMVGEMRDLETVEIAIETAETGHLVFGTLHTTTAASTIDRIIDQFSADRQSQIRTMLSESLKGVVAQVLLKKVGGGRVAALEILIVTPGIANLIREAKLHQVPSLMQTGKKFGMQLLNDALLQLVEAGKVAPKEAWLKSAQKADIEPKLRALGYDVA
jgi:twitching motility protein PilT